MQTTPRGIRANYPLLPFTRKARAYLALTRPFTLVAPLVAILAVLTITNHPWWKPLLDSNTRLQILHGATTLLLVQVGSGLVNQAHDLTEDQITKPYRPIPTGAVTTDEALALGHAAWFIAILRAATINLEYATLVTILVLLSYAYSTPPLRLKARPWLGNITIALARGIIGFTAAWTIIAPANTPTPWALGGIITLFLVGATTAKDFMDAEGDRTAGNHTLVVKYGPHRAAIVSLPFILTPILTLPYLALRGYIHLSDPGYILTLVVISWFILAFLRDSHDPHPNRYLEGTRSWTLMYATILTLMLNTSIETLIP